MDLKADSISKFTGESTKIHTLIRGDETWFSWFGFARKVVIIGIEGLAPEEQHVYSTRFP